MSDNARAARIRADVAQRRPVDVNREMTDALENWRAKDATGVIPDTDKVHAILDDAGGNFQVQNDLQLEHHKGARNIEYDWTKQTTPIGPPVDPKTGRVISQEAALASKETKLATVGTKATEKTGRGARALAKLGKAGRHFAAAIPVLGIVAGQASAAHAASKGDYTGAAMDEAGFIPVAGDLLDAARGGYALGEVANELLVSESLAMKHGDVAKAMMQRMGAGEALANVAGGLAAAGSAIGQVLVKASPVGFLFR